MIHPKRRDVDLSVETTEKRLPGIIREKNGRRTRSFRDKVACSGNTIGTGTGELSD